jgi:nucleoside-diphosphate-sugar epimerase
MILITGGLGFFGTHLARYLLDQGEEVVLTRHRTSRLPAFLENDLNRSLKIAECDILDLANFLTVLKKYCVTSIIHAAVAIPAKAPLYRVMKTSVEGTSNVLEAAKLMEVRKVTFTSSITVYYGRQDDLVYKETTPIRIDVNHPIATEKIAAEACCNLYEHEYGVHVVIVRPSMIYGPQGHGLAPIDQMVEGVTKQKKTVISQFSPDYSMDFLYIEDCCHAIGMIHLAKEPKHKVYNVAYGKGYYLHEVARVIQKLVPESELELKGSRVPWPLFSVDTSRLRDEFAFRPAFDLEQGLRKCIEERRSLKERS